MTFDQGTPVVGAVPRGANGLGIAGFICSLLGLCSLGLLSPVGLVLSLIAVGRPPRGWAIAGIILGALGSCGLVIGVILAVVVPVVALGVLAAGAAAMGAPQIECAVEMIVLDVNVQQYEKQHGGKLPPTLAEATTGIDAKSGLRLDPWGHAYQYEISEDGAHYRLFSMGPDGIAGTPDDVESVTEHDKTWKKQSGTAPASDTTNEEKKDDSAEPAPAPEEPVKPKAE